MSAPSIPNLLSLRGRGGSRGLRGRSRGRGPTASSSSHVHSDDITIQGTDTDAAVSRLSAVDIGYLDDPYARYFVSSIDGPPARRFPIINRGTYTRTTAINRLIQSFLTDGSDEGGSSQKQIVSLGAGTDTRPFHLFAQHRYNNLIYHEMDYAVTSAKKLKTVEAAPPLTSILTGRSSGDSGNWTSRPAAGGEYYSHGLDIRTLSATVNEPFPGLRTDLPTLILSECCLCYLSQEESERILQYFSSRISNLAVIIYEPQHLDNAFSDTMVSNLAARNIHMPGLDHYRNKKDQETRLQKAGFESIHHMTIDGIWEKWITGEEKERVDRLEGLDEVEEWKLLAGHYIIVWGTKGLSLGSLADVVRT